MTRGRVHVLLPVKSFACAKTRLAGVLAASERAALARLMFEDVLDTLAACRDFFFRTLVVTSDRHAAVLARHYGADVLVDTADCGLNASLSLAMRGLDLGAEDAVLILPSDVPQVTRMALATAAAVVAVEPSVAINAATRDGGTNLLACRPVGAIPPLFGPHSFERHCAAAVRAGLPLRVLALPELSLDIDLPGDLRRFLALNSNTRTHVFLSGISARRRLDRRCSPPLERSAAEAF